MTTQAKSEQRSAALPVTFQDELKNIANQRGPNVDTQELVRDAVRRHAAAGLITVTDILLIQDQAQRFFAETMVQGKRVNLGEQRIDDVTEDEWPFHDVLLCSLMKAPDGSYVLPALKVGPPIAGSAAQLRRMDVDVRDGRRADRYNAKEFKVDPKTGVFTKPVDPSTAVLLLRNHGASVRLPRYSRRWTGPMKDPGSREVKVDEWILAEKAWIDSTPSVIGKPVLARVPSFIVTE